MTIKQVEKQIEQAYKKQNRYYKLYEIAGNKKNYSELHKNYYNYETMIKVIHHLNQIKNTLELLK